MINVLIRDVNIFLNFFHSLMELSSWYSFFYWIWRNVHPCFMIVLQEQCSIMWRRTSFLLLFIVYFINIYFFLMQWNVHELPDSILIIVYLTLIIPATASVPSLSNGYLLNVYSRNCRADVRLVKDPNPNYTVLLARDGFRIWKDGEWNDINNGWLRGHLYIVIHFICM